MPMVNFITPFLDDPFVGHLGTLITISFFTGVLLITLPAYRPSMSAKARGTEIGFTHGYFLFGPFYSFGPLRPDNILTSTEIVPFATGVLATIAVIIILTIASSVYADVMFQQYPDPKGYGYLQDRYKPEELEPDKYYNFDTKKWIETLSPKVVRKRYKGPFDYREGWESFTDGFLRGGIVGGITASVLVYIYASNSEFLASSFL